MTVWLRRQPAQQRVEAGRVAAPAGKGSRPAYISRNNRLTDLISTRLNLSNASEPTSIAHA